MKRLIISILLISMMFLYGCGEGGNDSVGPSKTPFVGGTTALGVEFVQGAPPERVLDDDKQEFSISLSIENLGEEDVQENEGYVEISGVDPTEFSLSNNDIVKNFPDDIPGVKTYPGGTVVRSGRTLLEFPGFRYEGDLPGNWEPRIRANVCYNYATNATVAACVKEDMLSKYDRKEVCELTGEKVVFNSGAPLQITKVSQTPLSSDKIQLQFTISHVGEVNDRFFKTDTDCEDSHTNNDKDKVHFEVLTDINGNKAQCSGFTEGSGNSGFVKLYNGVDQIVTCNFDVGDVNTDFEKLINVRLEYRYYQFIEKNILIEDI
ncbi:hypothetical protein H6503_01590 [Candidatus Woesearchaeota archaeon]|nr:hypothetical protein [Candidatus Woesearchaeota archaeon]